jgi:hypothetical protein
MPATIRLEKEARALFWPWLAVISLAALRFVWEGYSVFGLVLGVPVLAAFSFGYEFHHGTMAQLLSLPGSRMKIWAEKLMVMTLAVATASAAFAYVWRAELTREHVQAAGLYLMMMTASAAYWTLRARSTLGGVVLAWLPLWCFWLTALVFDYFIPGTVFGALPFLLQGDLPPEQATEALTLLSLVVFGYAGLMLWMGARKLARFQVTGEGTDKDLLADLPRMVPEALAARFQSQPAEPVLNLLRKEFRLLRPVWLLTLLFLVYMTCLLSLGGGWPEGERSGGRLPLREIAFIVPVVSFVPMAALLAGCLSLGDERKWGTHSWHLTLPVSIRRQWLTKLVTGVLTGVVCAALLPALLFTLAGKIGGSPGSPKASDLIQWIALIALFSMVSFWCACVAHGTVRGALWVVPVFGLLGLASSYGLQWAGKLIQSTGSLRDFFVSWLQLDPVAFPSIRLFAYSSIWMAVPVAAFALFQSHRLYRTQPQESMLWMARRMLPLALVALVTSFAVVAAGAATWNPLPETAKALEELQAGDAPRQLDAADLVRIAPLSAHTRRWLRGARIAIAPDQATQGYIATIGLASGLQCKIAIKRHQGRPILWRIAECERRGS